MLVLDYRGAKALVEPAMQSAV